MPYFSESEIDEQIQEYRGLLDSEVSEHELHQFLASHSHFFNGALRLFGHCPLYSKVKLGHDHEVDFAWFDTGSLGPEWRLVEIESPTQKLFTQAGEPTAALNHAVLQVRDWHDWIHENLDYARKLMPRIKYPLGYVFMGRRSELTPSNQKRFRRLVHDNRMLMEIHTLDWFASAAATTKNLVEDGGGGGWTVPKEALSHSDLSSGLPTEAMEWMESPFVECASENMIDERLNERRYSHLHWPEISSDSE